MGKSRKEKKIFRKNKENKRKFRKLIFHNCEVLRKIKEEILSEQRIKELTLDGSFFKLAMKVASQTIGLNLTPVKPMSGELNEEMYTNERRKQILEGVLSDNDIDYDKLEEMKKDFMTNLPECKLVYLDFKYDPKNNKK